MARHELTTTDSAVLVGVPMLSAEEARQIVKNINGRIDQCRRDLLELYDREGWKALGYSSWGACAKAEFGSSAGTLYRQLEAAMIERDVLQDSQVENRSPIPTAQLQAAKPLAPADRPKAFKRADELAGDAPRTAKHITQAVQEIAQPDLPPEFAIIKRRYEQHDYALNSAWDGAVQRFVVRKDGGTGVVMRWPDVLGKLEAIEAAPNPDPAAPAFRMTCPTCGETIVNGVWGDLKECGSCYHTRQRQPPAGDPLPTALTTMVLTDLDALLPKALQNAGYYWHSATPLVIAHNDGWRGDAPTVDQALDLARIRERSRTEGEYITLPPFPAKNAPALMDSISFLLEMIAQWVPSSREKAAPALGLLRAIGRKTLEATE